jgi:hypothetical protein
LKLSVGISAGAMSVAAGRDVAASCRKFALPTKARLDKFPAMPRPAKLLDLSDVDITELKLMILAALKRHGMGPEWRRSMRGAQIGGMLDLCGGARQPRRL